MEFLIEPDGTADQANTRKTKNICKSSYKGKKAEYVKRENEWYNHKIWGPLRLNQRVYGHAISHVVN